MLAWCLAATITLACQRLASQYLPLLHKSTGPLAGLGAAGSVRLPMLVIVECVTLLLLRRRRPFLIRPLENTLIKLLRSLDFYDEPGRVKIAMGAAPELSDAYQSVILLPKKEV